MNVMLLGLLVGAILAAQPLQVVGVMRTGTPPFEEGERLYRLEGEGCQTLAVSERLTLRRKGEKRNLGRLEVTAIQDGYALARLAASGDTYPLKGDLAVRHERVRAIPALPPPPEPLTFSPEALAPRVPQLTIPSSLSKAGERREPIFFLKGSAELSPAGLNKLRSWVGAWGLDGRWLLLVPELPGSPKALTQARLEALRGALKELGVMEVTLRPLPSGPLARYDSISISMTPWQ